MPKSSVSKNFISTKIFSIIFAGIILILSSISISNVNKHIKEMGESDDNLTATKNALIGISVLTAIVIIFMSFHLLFKKN
jgi:hypothetical protein